MRLVQALRLQWRGRNPLPLGGGGCQEDNSVSEERFLMLGFSVKDRTAKANGVLAGEGHGRTKQSCQVLAGEMKPNLVSALIQRGALR